MGRSRPAAESSAPSSADRRARHEVARQSLWVIIGLIAGMVVAMAWIPFRRDNSTVDVALALVVVITLMGITTRRSAMVAAAVSSAAGFTFFDTVPYDRFTITGTADVVTAVLLVVVGLLTGELAIRVARQGRTDRRETANFDRVRQAASLLAHGEELVVMIGSVAEDLARLLDLRDCWFAAEPVEAGAWFVDRSGGIRRSEQRGPVVRSPYRRSDQVALPVWGQGQVLGHFVLQVPRGAELTAGQLLVAVTLADQVGAALVAQAPSIAWSWLAGADRPDDEAAPEPPAPRDPAAPLAPAKPPAHLHPSASLHPAAPGDPVAPGDPPPPRLRVIRGDRSPDVHSSPK